MADRIKIPFDESGIKVRLVQLIKQCEKSFRKFFVDDIARKIVHVVLQLPPWYCSLSPIEMAWS